MIILTGADGVSQYPLEGLAPSAYSITHDYDGLDTLQFEISSEHPQYDKLAEELRVEAQGRYYLIKGMCERRGGTTTVDCALDLSALQARFYMTYNHSEMRLQDVLAEVLPEGWQAQGGTQVTDLHKLELERVTAYDILQECMEIYGVVYDWDNKRRIVRVIVPENAQPTGIYITDELNLRSVTFTGESTDLVTRLYPYGKDGLSIVSVNEGTEFIEDFSYTNRVICATWEDRDCEDPQLLKDRALEQLKRLAVPRRSYELDVVDLAKMDPRYSQLKLGLYDKVLFMDDRRHRKEEHQVVEYVEYPLMPEKNVVTLSSVPEKITGVFQSTIKEIKEELQSGHTKLNEVVRDLDATTSRLTETYTKGETEVLLQSQITQAADVIRTEVAETYATGKELERESSRIDQRIEQITLSAQKTGGDNLVAGSSGRLGLEDWATEGQVTTDTSSETYRQTAAGGGFILAGGADTSGAMRQYIKTVPGGQYAWYFKYKLEVGLQTEAAVAFGRPVEEITPTDEWVERTGSFIAQSEETEVSFACQNGVLAVADIIVKAGLVCTAWQQSRGEVEAGGVTVNRRGLQVDVEGDPFAVQIDNKQFLVQNKDTGKDVVYLTKDDALIARLTAQEELTVQRYENPVSALRIIPMESGAFFVIND